MQETMLKYLLSSVIYSVVGIVILVVCFVIVEKMTPENLWKKILVENNTALAIMGGAFMIAISIIIASAIHG